MSEESETIEIQINGDVNTKLLMFDEAIALIRQIAWAEHEGLEMYVCEDFLQRFGIPLKDE